MWIVNISWILLLLWCTGWGFEIGLKKERDTVLALLVLTVSLVVGPISIILFRTWILSH